MPSDPDSFDFSIEFDDSAESPRDRFNDDNRSAPRQGSRAHGGGTTVRGSTVGGSTVGGSTGSHPTTANRVWSDVGETRSKSELLEAELLETLRPPSSADASALRSFGRGSSVQGGAAFATPTSGASTAGSSASSASASASASGFGTSFEREQALASRPGPAPSGPHQSDAQIGYYDPYASERKTTRPLAESHRWDDVTPRNSSSDLLAPPESLADLDRTLQPAEEPLVAKSFIVHPKPGLPPISLPSWSDRGETYDSSDFDSPRPALRPGFPASGSHTPSQWPHAGALGGVPSTLRQSTLAHAHTQSSEYPHSLDIPSTDPTGGQRHGVPAAPEHAVTVRDTRPPRLAQRSSGNAQGSFEAALSPLETAPPITRRGTDRGAFTPKPRFRARLVLGVAAAFLGPFLVASFLSGWLSGNFRDETPNARAPSVAPAAAMPVSARSLDAVPQPGEHSTQVDVNSQLEIQDLSVAPQRKVPTESVAPVANTGSASGSVASSHLPLAGVGSFSKVNAGRLGSEAPAAATASMGPTPSAAAQPSASVLPLPALSAASAMGAPAGVSSLPTSRQVATNTPSKASPAAKAPLATKTSVSTASSSEEKAASTQASPAGQSSPIETPTRARFGSSLLRPAPALDEANRVKVPAE